MVSIANIKHIQSIFILLKRPFFASNFFSYMRLYVANCLILSVVSLTAILATTRRFFTISNTYEAAFYSNYVYTTAENCLILFSSAIEICLFVERILYLLPSSFQRVKLLSFKKFFFILFIICIAINMPVIFLLDLAHANIQLDSNTQFRIWYFESTVFSTRLTGQVFIYFVYAFRDILPMIFKLVLNSFSVYLVRKYVKNKRSITTQTESVNSQMVNFDRKQTYIALVMNTLSLLEHLLCIASYVLFFFYYFELSYFIYVIAFLFIAIKHSLIFFILLALNNLFRNQVFKVLKF